MQPSNWFSDMEYKLKPHIKNLFETMMLLIIPQLRTSSIFVELKEVEAQFQWDEKAFLFPTTHRPFFYH